ncbi:MAG: hypothetical protein V4635_16275 [Bacteroidota bacterium]
MKTDMHLFTKGNRVIGRIQHQKTSIHRLISRIGKYHQNLNKIDLIKYLYFQPKESIFKNIRHA